MDDLRLYLTRTLNRMAELRIPVRDTYSEELNLDDQLSNGRPGGPRLLRIDWIETGGYPHTKSKIYEVQSRKSVAYDAYTIVVPTRYRGSARDDAIVHEVVHFLQHNTREEDGGYVHFVGDNYLAYLAQRVELEAHSVQVLDILRSSPSYVTTRLSEEESVVLKEALEKVVQGQPLTGILPALLMCKDRRLI